MVEETKLDNVKYTIENSKQKELSGILKKQMEANLKKINELKTQKASSELHIQLLKTQIKEK